MCAYIVKKLFPKISSKAELLAARVSLILVSGFAAHMALSNNESLYFGTWAVLSFWNPIMFLPLCVGFLGFYTNGRSFKAGCVAAIIGAILGCYISGEFSNMSKLIGISFSAIGLFGMHYWQKANGVLMTSIKSKRHSSRFIKINSWHDYFNFNKLLKSSESLVTEHGRNYFIAGVVGWIIVLLGMFLTGVGHSHVVVGLYIISSLLCAVFLINECFMPLKLIDKYLPLHFHLTLVVSFIITAQYLLLISNFDQLWLLNVLICTMIVYLLAGIRVTIVISIIGFMIAGFLNFTFQEVFLPMHNLQLYTLCF